MNSAASAELVEQTRNRIAELEMRLNAIQKELQHERERYRELRHRIRNDLQSLTTLLSVQAKIAQRPENCSRCILRLRSAAELHNALDDDGCSDISMSAYLRALADTRKKAFGERINSAVFLEPGIFLDHRSAQCVGLVFIEAATNAMKHAFPDGSAGRIEARFRRSEGLLELSVADDGVGFDPQSVDRGDGIELMRGLAAQLRGELRLEHLPRGSVVRLLFADPTGVCGEGFHELHS